VIELTVVFDAEGGTSVRTYKGKDELTVLKKISDIHSYGCDDEDEPKKPLTAKAVWKSIWAQNGDGCDMILAIFAGKPTKYRGPK
jgi:hypothetical protein